ncbi:MAG: alanine racemase [Deltaproteobacteria bacterium]|jgi:diaminopimelate decarboxylase|nr:alanine racemase [Deltaproteobacteria bacterium]
MTTQASDLRQAFQAALSRSSPLLPKKELLEFVSYYFDRRERYLRILSEHPAPLYLQDAAVLKARATRFREAFQAVLPSVGCYFAVKSNNHPDISEIMIATGFGLDVSSGIELQMALKLDARDIVFSGPGKTDEELQLAVSHADRVVILMDSFGELSRLGDIAAKLNTEVRCGVRLNSSPKGLWRKFGIPVPDLLAFWEQARRLRGLKLIGLQFHSSWNLSPRKQVDFVRTLGKALSRMPPSFQTQLEFIDIGGGYWPSQGEWLQPAGTSKGRVREALGRPAGPVESHHRLPAAPIEEFAEKLGAAIHKHIFNIVPCRICLEPGRWICNDAVHLLLSVVDKKAPDLVITDAGTNTVGWERFESDYFPILNLTRPSLSEKPCLILGSLCTPHDIWGYMYFGDDIQPGDILMIPTQGAYTYSLKQNFIKPLPAVHTIH